MAMAMAQRVEMRMKVKDACGLVLALRESHVRVANMISRDKTSVRTLTDYIQER